MMSAIQGMYGFLRALFYYYSFLFFPYLVIKKNNSRFGPKSFKLPYTSKMSHKYRTLYKMSEMLLEMLYRLFIPKPSKICRLFKVQ